MAINQEGKGSQRGEDSEGFGLDYGVPTLVDAELVIDVDRVTFYGRWGKDQRLGNLLIAQTPAQQGQDVQLAVGEGSTSLALNARLLESRITARDLLLRFRERGQDAATDSAAKPCSARRSSIARMPGPRSMRLGLMPPGAQDPPPAVTRRLQLRLPLHLQRQ